MATGDREVIVGNSIDLEIKVYNILGNLVDADSTPLVQIKDVDSNIYRNFSASGVYRVDTGEYRLTFPVSSTADEGVWTDTWKVFVDGNVTTSSFYFTVLTNSAIIKTPGSQIGDSPTLNYTSNEIDCINILMEQLRCRLKDKKTIKGIEKDAYGVETLVECPVFSDMELLCFLQASLSEFNQTPHFTSFTFSDTVICDRFAHVIVEGAYIIAIGAQMLIEAGREFTISDNGITMQPPPLSQTLNSSLSTFITRHSEALKFIKNNLKPAPYGVGTFRVLAVSPAILRLRHLRARQII